MSAATRHADVRSIALLSFASLLIEVVAVVVALRLTTLLRGLLSRSTRCGGWLTKCRRNGGDDLLIRLHDRLSLRCRVREMLREVIRCFLPRMSACDFEGRATDCHPVEQCLRSINERWSDRAEESFSER